MKVTILTILEILILVHKTFPDICPEDSIQCKSLLPSISAPFLSYNQTPYIPASISISRAIISPLLHNFLSFPLHKFISDRDLGEI